MKIADSLSKRESQVRNYMYMFSPLRGNNRNNCCQSRSRNRQSTTKTGWHGVKRKYDALSIHLLSKSINFLVKTKLIFNKNKKPFQKRKGFSKFVMNYLIFFESSNMASIGFNAFNRRSSSMIISGKSYFIHKYNFSNVFRFI